MTEQNTKQDPPPPSAPSKITTPSRGLLKPYRLKSGVHYHPNPDWKEGMNPNESHKEAKVGDIVHLTKAQFESFKDRFEPTDRDVPEISTGEGKDTQAAA